MAPLGTLGPFGSDVYAELQALAHDDEGNNWALAYYLDSIGSMFDEVEGYARDGSGGELGWSILVDLNRAPAKALPWLGQFVGVPVPSSLPESQARARIAAQPGFQRGTLPAMVAAAQVNLTGTKDVLVTERYQADAYKLYVATRRAQTPVEDWASTNLIPNANANVDLTGWGNNPGATWTRISDGSQGPPKFGTVYVRLNANVIANNTNSFPSNAALTGATAGRRFSASVYVRGYGSSIGKSVSLDLYEGGGATGEAMLGRTTVALTSNWQRITVSNIAVVHNDCTYLRCYTPTVNTLSDGDAYHVSGFQIEEQTQVTPYIDTTNAPASRAAGQGAVGASLLAQKPAGIALTYETIPGQTFNELLANAPLFSNVFSTYATFQGVLTNQPGT